MSSSREMIARCYYWMGECFYAQRSFQRALELFRRVYDDYTSETKASDAPLKMGFTYSELKDYNEAMQVLKEFLEKYPTHRAATLAEEKISWIENLQSGSREADSTQKK